MRARAAAVVLGAAMLAAPVAANAIIMRHDVDEARYRDLGETQRGVLVALALPAQADGAPMLYSGMGTLIAPDWVLTAAHAAVLLAPKAPGEPLKEHYVFIKGRGYKVAKVILHPAWKNGGDDNSNDIALIQLDHPILDPAPACLYDRTDEAGQITTLAGQGLPGDGLKGPGARDGVLRGATVRIDTAEPTVLTWTFRAPGDPKTTPMEGISGPGDSGGPALLPLDGRVCVAGVSSEQRDDVANRVQGHYGVIEVYTRVSAFLPWIRAAMAGKSGS